VIPLSESVDDQVMKQPLWVNAASSQLPNGKPDRAGQEARRPSRPSPPPPQYAPAHAKGDARVRPRPPRSDPRPPRCARRCWRGCGDGEFGEKARRGRAGDRRGRRAQGPGCGRRRGGDLGPAPTQKLGPVRNWAGRDHKAQKVASWVSTFMGWWSSNFNEFGTIVSS
jgi:hypothetical protein